MVEEKMKKIIEEYMTEIKLAMKHSEDVAEVEVLSGIYDFLSDWEADLKGEAKTSEDWTKKVGWA